ncbi:DNA polymerase III subunit delta' [Nitrosomonas oligotropha]|uniref:DNA polymerase III subunit delta' n=1 Tax=Nitrosomonas oligotropha TaxID=42354 RepID=A0A1H8R836_9PROT|nr:DNA polymerase III subunit delta' [Nitrosomonas oligotropha]SDW84110.1 DNA polymerase III, delta prime subunit [Nitrosomonas oligotropha]SEO62570.1 DNA polymerase III, delta prime subunit [Nitrosomonas oligotropha]
MADIYSWQHDIWQRLTHNRQFQGRALLLKGKKGTGKYEFARQLAKSLLCAAPAAEQKACGACLSCGWFEQSSHPNFYQVMPEALLANSNSSAEKEDSEEKSGGAAPKKSASQQIGVEQIRKLTDFVYMSGHQNGLKIILIYPAETMNSAAANALLKKLEEPPEQVLFLLVTHQAQRLLPTIRSRCQQIAMPLPDAAAALAWLKQQEVSDPEASLAAAGFSPLMALLLAKGEAAQYGQFIEQIGHPNRLDPLSLAETLQQTNLSVVVNWLQKWCYDLVSYRTSGKIRYYVKQLPAIQALSGQMDLPGCVAFTQGLNVKQQLSHHPLNPRLFLEELFIAYAALMGKK